MTSEKILPTDWPGEVIGEDEAANVVKNPQTMGHRERLRADTFC